MDSPPRVSYIWSQPLQDAADQLPSNVGRSSVVHSLIRSLDLLDDKSAPGSPSNGSDSASGIVQEAGGGAQLGGRCRSRAVIVAPDLTLGTAEALKKYHDAAYVGPSSLLEILDQAEAVESLLSVSSDPEDDDHIEGSDSSSSSSPYRPRKRRREIHGLENDCPPFPLLRQYALLLAAATQTACRRVGSGESDVAICWDGGRHHAMRSRASGFCYVADAVLAIMWLTREGRTRDPAPDKAQANGHPPANGVKLAPRRPRVMYLDLDLHYGDGVAQAFLSPTHYPFPFPASRKPPRPPQVLTMSIHHSSPVFFPPATPHSSLPSPNTPHPFTLSIPLAAYASPKTYKAIFPSVESVREAFQPDYVVLQLGADGLPRDPVGLYGRWGVEGDGGMLWCVEQVRRWGIPIVVLGGGGYDHPNTARAWARVTALVLSQELSGDTEVPHHEHFPEYAPSFTLEVSESNIKDENYSESIAQINETFQNISERIKEITAAHI